MRYVTPLSFYTPTTAPTHTHTPTHARAHTHTRCTVWILSESEMEGLTGKERRNGNSNNSNDPNEEETRFSSSVYVCVFVCVCVCVWSGSDCNELTSLATHREYRTKMYALFCLAFPFCCHPSREREREREREDRSHGWHRKGWRFTYWIDTTETKLKDDKNAMTR